MIGLFVFPQTEIRGRFLSHNRTTHFAFSPFFLFFFFLSRFFCILRSSFLSHNRATDTWWKLTFSFFSLFSYVFFVFLEIASNCTTELYTFPFPHVFIAQHHSIINFAFSFFSISKENFTLSKSIWFNRYCIPKWRCFIKIFIYKWWLSNCHIKKSDISKNLPNHGSAFAHFWRVWSPQTTCYKERQMGLYTFRKQKKLQIANNKWQIILVLSF